ncbi:hypothetical protein PF010_g30127 [Phytophthora fragariae]|uniref:FYVE-type domain-containing protein n=2 Tax=Phytophthora fragariae TaxID=53985 RepID=A0A6A3GWA3_9STRA|nr:hypothetical protein PF009_g30827 [Phytophthora fragariae]KAE8961213.1 hypothetical protein PF011_g29831 [Phytophthora fragariae]KAE9060662.1 hypothetical protein PF010_g30127 [Phytophthora fragariae]KAE9066017.1 hypothetical protein PF006_g30331 [Phytophthora fragariae]KAE9165387.1 hypothetical protein PF004_g29517 [Phytophthora fragariae]
MNGSTQEHRIRRSHAWVAIDFIVKYFTTLLQSTRDTHMKFTLPKNAFPVLELSKERQHAFIEEADTVVKEIVAANDAFIANEGSLRDSEWRLIRTKEGMQVYRQRRKAIDRRGRKESSAPLIASPSWSSSHALSRYRTDTSESAADRGTSLSSSSGVAEDSIMEKLRPPGVSLMALHGTTDGTLDDCIFAGFAPNDDEWKLRSSYIDDRLDDARIVASIRGPTKEDPYRFLGIKWFAKEHPVVLTGIVQQRDFLILESSGFTRDCNGEKVGYFLMHSVALREIQELSHLGIVRGLMSYCYIFRQCKSGKVDVYTRGFCDFRGEIPGRLALAISADAALCCVNLIQYAYIKKLTWLLKHSGQSRSGNETQPTCCEACEKSFTKCSLISTGPGTACSICRKIVCTKCSVLKKMVMDVSSTGSAQHCSLPFCLGCLLKAKRQCGWEIALSDVKYSGST